MARTEPSPQSFASAPLRSRVGLRDIRIYQVCDTCSGWLLLGMLLLSPWLFGATQPEVIFGLNLAGYALGLLLAMKYGIRTFKGFRPATWDQLPSPRRQRLVQSLLWLTAAVLGFILISVLNARARWDYPTQTLLYRPALAWLPHSYDQGRSWELLLNYAALACFFWALWDWLRGKTAAEQQADRRQFVAGAEPRRTPLPSRLRWLLWLLFINGGLLALEAIVQRQSGTTKLLFLVSPRHYQQASFEFGPFAYRANGAQYLNLLWPVCLGFWWTLHRSAASHRWQHHLLLPFGVLMAIGPFISTSKAGALISGSMALAAALFLGGLALLFPDRPGRSISSQLVPIGLLTGCIAVGALLVWNIGWDSLSERMLGLDSGLAGRELMFDTARRMVPDFRWFGCGPGTFSAVFPLYRTSQDEYWPGQLHNDWLETQITFGWIGLGLILLAFGLVLARWWQPGGIPSGRRLVGLLWLALAGVLVHARFDFPFQVYSILMLALAWCAVILSLSRRGTRITGAAR